SRPRQGQIVHPGHRRRRQGQWGSPSTRIRTKRAAGRARSLGPRSEGPDRGPSDRARPAAHVFVPSERPGELDRLAPDLDLRNGVETIGLEADFALLSGVVPQRETEAFSLNLASIDNKSRTLEEPCGAYSKAATGKRFVRDGKVHRELLG